MSSINFDNPFLLLLIIPVLLVIIGSFVFTINKENKTINNTISFVCHIIIGILVVLTISKTTLETVITKTEIYILADISYSANDNMDLIDQYIKNVEKEAPRNSSIGVITFGKDYQLLVKPGDKIVSVKNSNVDNSETNIAAALEYASTLFSEDVIKRIVIISDGEETNDSNIISLSQTLSQENIYIDAIYVDNNLKEDIDEIQINQVEFTPSTYLDEEETVAAIVQSNIETKAIISLYLNGEVYKEKALNLTKGYNSILFDLDTKTPGIKNYELKLESNTDSSKLNNSYLFNQEVSQKLKVLFLSSTNSDKIIAEELYSDSADVDFFINNKDIPFTVEDLSIYDEFILSNVDVRDYNNHTQFVSSLDTLVSEFGKSLITFGNTYIQNNEEDEVLSSLSNMLPLKYGTPEEDNKLVTLLIDISRSMEFSYKLVIAKAAACAIVDNLDDNIMVSVIAFFGEVGTVINATPASERETIKEKINELNVYQGTFLGAALEYSHKFMLNMPYDKKEIMLISDGLPYREQENQSVESVSNMAKRGISVSTILTVKSIDGEKLMRKLAETGRGYYYLIESEKDVESFVLDEVLNALTDVILDKNESLVNINSSKNSLIDGVEYLPNIKGLYNNSEKSSAEVILTAIYKDILGNEFDVPLYAYWNYGNGKVSSFASTISGDWIEHWENDVNAMKVLSNVLESNKPQERIDSAFIVTSETNGTITSITVKAPTLNKNSQLLMSIKCPNGEVIEKELSFDSENYLTDIKTEQVGKYEATFYYTLGTIEYEADYIFNISYLPEYNRFTIYEASNLYYIISTNGKISEDGNLKIENKDAEVQKYILDFTPIFMIICVVLFIADVMVRKLRLQDIKSLFRFVKKEKYYK